MPQSKLPGRLRVVGEFDAFVLQVCAELHVCAADVIHQPVAQKRLEKVGKYVCGAFLLEIVNQPLHRGPWRVSTAEDSAL